MVGTIRFPHLGISLSHVIRSVSIGGFEIACYGMVLAAAMVTGLFLVMRLARFTGQDEDSYFDFGMIVILVSVICARIYYVVFSWDYYRVHPSEILNLREGGLAIYGGVIGGALTAVIYSRIRKKNLLQLLDSAAVGLAWGQMVGRWGNFFNREAFGDYTDNLFAMQLPLDDVRSWEVTQEMLDHTEIIDGVSYIQVHPTFLYESLWNLGVVLILLFLILKVKKQFFGRAFFTYLLLYGIGRAWIEGLRTDQLWIPGTEIPVSQLLSVLFAIAGGISLFLLSRKSKKKPVGENNRK